jgi:hypothetical protein
MVDRLPLRPTHPPPPKLFISVLHFDLAAATAIEVRADPVLLTQIHTAKCTLYSRQKTTWSNNEQNLSNNVQNNTLLCFFSSIYSGLHDNYAKI